jgi:hypothetical protein
MRAFYRNHLACGDLQVVIIANDAVSAKQFIDIHSIGDVWIVSRLICSQ